MKYDNRDDKPDNREKPCCLWDIFCHLHGEIISAVGVPLKLAGKVSL
jgi:hypothetical protein